MIPESPIANEIYHEQMSMAASAQMVLAGTIVIAICVALLVATGQMFYERREKRKAREVRRKAFWAKVESDFALVERLTHPGREAEVVA